MRKKSMVAVIATRTQRKADVLPADAVDVVDAVSHSHYSKAKM
jgi:hypothetical protein